MYKINDKSPWTPGFIFLNDGVLTVKESPSSLKNISVIQCHSFCQVNDLSRPYTFKVHFNPYSFILFAAPDESQLFDWLQNIMISIKINDNRVRIRAFIFVRILLFSFNNIIFILVKLKRQWIHS